MLRNDFWYSRDMAESKTKKSQADEVKAPQGRARSMEEENISPLVGGPVQKELLWEWEAAERPFTPLNREVFSTILAGVFLLAVILFFIEGVMPVVMLASFVFLWYVLGTVKPGNTIHRLLTWGIETNGKIYPWEMMRRFWIEGQGENRMLVVELTQIWPRHLRVMIDNEETEAVLREVMLELLVEDEPAPNWVDKGAKWLEKRVRWSVK